MDGIIFDVDGTLWDSTDSVTESWNLAIRENSDMDLTITADILKGLFGKTMTEIADSLFPSLPEKERMDFLDICYDYENRTWRHIPATFMKALWKQSGNWLKSILSSS